MASLQEEKTNIENVEAADYSDRAHSAATTGHKGEVLAGSTKEGGPISPDDFGFSPEEQKKILRRVDRRLVLTVGAMYCISLMDRTNLGAANIAGMGKELMLIGNRYVSFSFFFLLSLTQTQRRETEKKKKRRE
jgi:hypothetical protein